MSANGRWSDFSFASTLLSLGGLKSGGHGMQSGAQQDADNIIAESARASAMADSDNQVDTMASINESAMDGIDGFESEHSGMGADFGELEMFDSAPIEASTSSRANTDTSERNGKRNGQAPAAVMSADEPPASQSKKSKRDKSKKKKKKHGDDSAGEPHEEGHHKRAKRAPIDEPEELAGSQEPADATQSKRKRRASDGEGEKRRKKPKSHASGDDTHEASHDTADTFLRTDRDSAAAPVAVMDEGDVADSDPQGSPTVAHVRRRSQSREARSREPSATREVAQDQDDGDDDRRAKTDLDAMRMDVEDMAREAWNKHVNGQGSADLDLTQTENPEVEDTRLEDAEQTAQDGAAENNNSTTSPSRSKRTSSRKKAKPTFFDQPPETNDATPADLPSPSAATPKPRKRVKTATKKTKLKSTKLSRSMNGGAEDDVYGFDAPQPKGRKNRLEGYTTGPFTAEELARIDRQVKAFAEDNDLKIHEVNEMIQAPGGTNAGEAHAQLWERLFAECPDRHRQKVINIARKKHHNFAARGSWTPEQEAELDGLIQIHGQKWSLIAGLINRHPEDIRDRYRNYMICGPSQRKDKWSEEETRELTQLVLSSMVQTKEMRDRQPDRKDLQKPYEQLVDWQAISEQMGRRRSRLQCITKWKSINLHPEIRGVMVALEGSSEDLFRLQKARLQIEDMPAQERYRLVLAVRDCGATSDAAIPWLRLLDRKYRARWHRETLGLLWHRLKNAVPGYQERSLRDCAQHLVSQYDEQGCLPDVDGDDYNDMEEMKVLHVTAEPASAARTKGKRKGKGRAHKAERSEEFVHSDEEEEEPTDEPAEDDEDAEAQEGGLQIDPALMAEEPDDAEAEAKAEAEGEAEVEEAAASPESIPAKKKEKKKKKKKQTAADKFASARKKVPAKTDILSEDPIQDSQLEPSRELPEQTPGDDDDDDVEASQQLDVEEPEPRQKKKKKKSGRNKKHREPSASPPPVSSDMSDMEDLPAKVPASSMVL